MTLVDAYQKKSDLELLLDIINEGVWDWNANTGHVNRSSGWFDMLQYEQNSFDPTVNTWENLIHPEDYPRVMQHFEDYITGESVQYKVEYRCRKSNGDYLWILDRGKIVERNPDGSVARMMGAHVDIDQLKTTQATLESQNKLLQKDNLNLETIVKHRTEELEAINQWLQKQVEQSQRDANTDPLTGLFNRRKFDEELEKEISRSRRYFSSMSLILLDLDLFKNINDAYGHKQGDLVLKTVAQALIDNIRSTDILARWGGEEFILILPQSSLEQSLISAEHIRKTIEALSFKKGFSITASFGVTEYKATDDQDSLFKRLDRALYRAKNSGRNCIHS
jgi:diguanylate cyclase (GGDEF)-like protein